MSSSFHNLPDIHFGKVGIHDAGAETDMEDYLDDDSDDELEHTPEDVIELLGFDPAEDDNDGDSWDEDPFNIEGAFSDDNLDPDAIVCDSWIAGDDSEFNEEEHPRGKGGKFAKKGSGFASSSKKTVVKNSIKKTLAAYGYTKKGMSPGGHHTFAHPSGHQVHIGPTVENQEHIAGYRINGQHGAGAGSLAKHLELHQSQNGGGSYPPVKVPPKTEAKATQSVIDPYPSIASGKIEHESATAEYTTNALGFKPVDEDEKWINYKDTKGNALSLAKKSDKDGYFEWGLYNGETANFTKGKGLTPLTAAVKAGELTASPLAKKTQVSVPQDAKVAKVESKPLHFQDANGEDFTEQGTQTWLEDKYTGYKNVWINASNESDNWKLMGTSIEGGTTTIDSGNGQKQLNTAFEALHPRDEHGHFIAKPGTEEFKDELNALSDDNHWNFGDKDGAVAVYEGDYGGSLFVSEKTGYWTLEDDKGKIIGNGKDLDSLHTFLKEGNGNNTPLSQYGTSPVETNPYMVGSTAYIKWEAQHKQQSFNAKPGTPEFIAELDKIDPQGDWTVSYQGIAATSYQDETGAQINVANEAGNWEHKDDSGVLLGEGDNLQSLYSHLKGDATASATTPDLGTPEEKGWTKNSVQGGFDYNWYDAPNGNVLWVNKDGSWEFFPDANTPAAAHGDPGQAIPQIGGGNAAQKAATPPPTPHKAVGDNLQFAKMKQTGPQLGSNPGGKYQDEDGKEYYIKQVQTNDHARNELLAAALFGAAGGQTLNYHHVVDGDKLYVATDWQPLDKNNVSQLSPAERTEARKDFPLQAWLANWDAAGMGGDNIGVVNGKVVPLDFGGSLLYRAKGSPKGSAWNTSVDEWTTLKDQYKNPDAAKLYADLTPQELEAGKKRLESIDNAKIEEIVNQYGPGTSVERGDLAHILQVRKKNLIEKINAEINKPVKPQATLLQSQPGSSTYDPGAARKIIAEWSPPGKPEQAVTAYKGSDYQPMNAMMRFFNFTADQKFESGSSQETWGKYIRQYTEWLHKASTKEDVVLYRGLKSDVAGKISYAGQVGMSLDDDGFVSMTTSKSFADGWHGGSGLTLKITVPKGSKAATVKSPHTSDGEYEVVGQRGTRFRITKWDPQKKIFEVELDQSHLIEEY